MHAKVNQTFHGIIRASGIRPRRALEVGGVMGPNSLLRFPELAGVERYCLNLLPIRSADGITAVSGNANNMSGFEDECFDLVMSNATLEHDKYFWLTLAEMRRVLAPGGMLVIGTPGYIRDPRCDHDKATHTYRVHYRFDYYRFSDQTFREVFFERMADVDVQSILRPPRIIGLGFKPGGDPAKTDRRAAAAALASGPATLGVDFPCRAMRAKTPRTERVGWLRHRLSVGRR